MSKHKFLFKHSVLYNNSKLSSFQNWTNFSDDSQNQHQIEKQDNISTPSLPTSKPSDSTQLVQILPGKEIEFPSKSNEDQGLRKETPVQSQYQQQLEHPPDCVIVYESSRTDFEERQFHCNDHENCDKSTLNAVYSNNYPSNYSYFRPENENSDHLVQNYSQNYPPPSYNLTSLTSVSEVSPPLPVPLPLLNDYNYSNYYNSDNDNYVPLSNRQYQYYSTGSGNETHNVNSYNPSLNNVLQIQNQNHYEQCQDSELEYCIVSQQSEIQNGNEGEVPAFQSIQKYHYWNNAETAEAHLEIEKTRPNAQLQQIPTAIQNPVIVYANPQYQQQQQFSFLDQQISNHSKESLESQPLPEIHQVEIEQQLNAHSEEFSTNHSHNQSEYYQISNSKPSSVLSLSVSACNGKTRAISPTPAQIPLAANKDSASSLIINHSYTYTDNTTSVIKTNSSNNFSAGGNSTGTAVAVITRAPAQNQNQIQNSNAYSHSKTSNYAPSSYSPKNNAASIHKLDTGLEIGPDLVVSPVSVPGVPVPVSVPEAQKPVQNVIENEQETVSTSNITTTTVADQDQQPVPEPEPVPVPVPMQCEEPSPNKEIESGALKEVVALPLTESQPAAEDPVAEEKLDVILSTVNPNIIIHKENGSPDTYECKICQRKFKSKNNFKYHLHELTDKKKFPYVCEHCGKGMIASTHYKYHLLTHSDERPHKCPVPDCSKGFLTSKKLTRHMLIHGKAKAHNCSQCSRGFHTLGELKQHELTHSGKEPFPCSLCPKKFTVLSQLKVHESTHTGQQKFMCDKCGRKFVRLKHLQNHLVIHTGEKPFKCSKCGKLFRTELSHAHHMKAHSDERPFRCETCNRGFVLQKDYIRHQNVHKDDAPFSCSQCDKKFRRKDNLSRHVKLHHTDAAIVRRSRDDLDLEL